MDIRRNEITALIGPSGCGKSTFLRCLNRMNDLIPGTKVDGTLLFQGQDLYSSDVDAVDVRRRIGMVFQKPNPFPKSIKDNIGFGLKVNGLKANDDKIEEVLRRAALWDEVKDKLKQDAFALSGRPAAAALHRARHRRRARGRAHGRALLGARPDLDAGHRGPDAGPRQALHDRHRHPQHAAGGARLAQDRLLHGRGARPGPALRRARGDGRHRASCSRRRTSSARRTTSRGASASARHRAAVHVATRSSSQASTGSRSWAL